MEKQFEFIGATVAIHQTGERVQAVPVPEERGHDGLTDDERMKQMMAPLPETCGWCGQKRSLGQENRQLREHAEEVEEFLPDACAGYQTPPERAKLLKYQLDYATEMVGQLREQIAAARKEGWEAGRDAAAAHLNAEGEKIIDADPCDYGVGAEDDPYTQTGMMAFRANGLFRAASKLMSLTPPEQPVSREKERNV